MSWQSLFQRIANKHLEGLPKRTNPSPQFFAQSRLYHQKYPKMKQEEAYGRLEQEGSPREDAKPNGSINNGTLNREPLDTRHLNRAAAMEVMWCKRCAHRGKLECDWTPNGGPCTKCKHHHCEEGYEPECEPADVDTWPAKHELRQKLHNLIRRYGNIWAAKRAVTPLAIPMKPEDRPIFYWCERCAKLGNIECHYAHQHPCKECSSAKCSCQPGEGVWPATNELCNKARLEILIVEERAAGRLAQSPAQGSLESLIAGRVYANSVQQDLGRSAKDKLQYAGRQQPDKAVQQIRVRKSLELVASSRQTRRTQPDQPPTRQGQQTRAHPRVSNRPRSGPDPFTERTRANMSNTVLGRAEANQDRLVEERVKNIVLAQQLKDSEAEISRLRRHPKGTHDSRHRRFASDRQREPKRRMSESSEDSEYYQRPRRSNGDKHSHEQHRDASSEDDKRTQKRRRAAERVPHSPSGQRDNSKRVRHSSPNDRHREDGARHSSHIRRSGRELQRDDRHSYESDEAIRGRDRRERSSHGDEDNDHYNLRRDRRPAQRSQDHGDRYHRR